MDTYEKSAAANASAPFREHLDQQHRSLWDAIYALPFVHEVGDGTLDERSFAFFIAEDLLYLDEFARVLARGAHWAVGDPATQRLFLEHSSNVYSVEEALHTALAAPLGIDIDAVRVREPAPVTAAYTNHLLRVAADGPLEHVVAAVLPCYWVYHRVGEHLSGRENPNALYAAWVASYGSPEFAEAVNSQLDLVDRLAVDASAVSRQRMEMLFRQSLRYEWMFWDQAYRRAGWPVGVDRAIEDEGRGSRDI